VTTIGTFNEVRDDPDPPAGNAQPHCQECHCFLPHYYDWEWEADDEERRVIWWVRCKACQAINRR
jgi:hypothetical protein